MNKLRNTLSTLNIIFTICSVFVIIFEVVKIDKFMPIFINKDEIIYMLFLIVMIFFFMIITSPIIISSFIIFLKTKDDKFLLRTMCINLFFKLCSILFTTYIMIYITGPGV